MSELPYAHMGIRTLYVGLSDGAKTDVFRRENEGHVSNEQVVAASEISDEKWEKLTKELRKRLDLNGFNAEEALFERICLLDDFTASGTTLIRYEKNEWSGKIPTFCRQNSHRVDIGKNHAIAEGIAGSTLITTLHRKKHLRSPLLRHTSINVKIQNLGSYLRFHTFLVATSLSMAPANLIW